MPAWPPLHVIGITHRKADLGLRERFARSSEEIGALLTAAGDGGSTGVMLSTCNRFEVYWWGSAQWSDWFARQGHQVPRTALVELQGLSAIRHLFTVAAGLDSQILGETEILGQVRRAWRLAREVGATSRELDLVFAAALAAGRRVRRETSLGRHPASIGSVAVDTASQTVDGWAGRVALVIGAGEAARRVVATLVERDAEVHVLSRHAERAQTVGQALGVRAESWQSLDDWLADADAVFTATSAPRAFLTRERLEMACARRNRPPLVLVDLGVPRNVAAEARNLAGLTILDLDDLRAHGSGALLDLAPALEAARLILERQAALLLDKLDRWSGPATDSEDDLARADSAG
jgi:glutamyl-tRNA reductase